LIFDKKRSPGYSGAFFYANMAESRCGRGIRIIWKCRKILGKDLIGLKTYKVLSKSGLIYAYHIWPHNKWQEPASLRYSFVYAPIFFEKRRFRMVSKVSIIGNFIYLCKQWSHEVFTTGNKAARRIFQ
jgi:hypothetical protein